MNVLVIFGSHRIGGTNAAIEAMLKELDTAHSFEYIHLADHKIEGCTSCHRCKDAGNCILPPSQIDCFQELFHKMVLSDAIFIITPVYAGIPSRLTALFERLTSVLYDTGMMNTDQNPLLNKKAAIFSYCSTQICDEQPVKLIFDKFVMKDYRFDVSTYQYLNNCRTPNEMYGSILDYVKDIVRNI
jgi:multimeric flavodoxin WrbA